MSDPDPTFGERLARLEATLERIEENLIENLDRYNRTFFGGNGNPGFITRIDRLEQEAKRRAKLYTLVAGLLSAVVTGLVLKQLH